ncbi:hypothetical protein Lalb_Chr04g0254811 [Lupinus albus]|uniref:Uncharacterized protein n=1 Tax=Lupinus albus TaxID=3870 RepID=A0A6A4QP09_LUPAL|nr:hypothetical protein Lalb_Chr04g0254811 [Lupinus albus]
MISAGYLFFSILPFTMLVLQNALVLWLKAPVMVDAGGFLCVWNCVCRIVVSIHGDRYAASIPANSSLKTLQYALTTSFGSIRYGSLFEAAIRTLW